jgi:hypothetical protein
MNTSIPDTELLSIRVLAENHKAMAAVWEYLASLPPQDVYFAKILYDKEATACLNRNNFPLHISAAVSAARFETPSMVNYRGNEGQIQSSDRIVSLYLSRRLTLSHHALLNETAAFSSPHEILEYHRMISTSSSEAVEPESSSIQRGQPVQTYNPLLGD